MDNYPHFVRQRRSLVAVSVLLAANFFFCLDLTNLSIFGVDTPIKDSGWVAKILIALWAYFCYGFRVARQRLSQDQWRIKDAYLGMSHSLVQSSWVRAVKLESNDHAIRNQLGEKVLPDSELTFQSVNYIGPPKFRLAGAERDVSFKITVNGLPRKSVQIKLKYGFKIVWQMRLMAAWHFLAKDTRLQEFYLPTFISIIWVIIWALDWTSCPSPDIWI